MNWVFFQLSAFSLHQLFISRFIWFIINKIHFDSAKEGTSKSLISENKFFFLHYEMKNLVWSLECYVWMVVPSTWTIQCTTEPAVQTKAIPIPLLPINKKRYSILCVEFISTMFQPPRERWSKQFLQFDGFFSSYCGCSRADTLMSVNGSVTQLIPLPASKAWGCRALNNFMFDLLTIKMEFLMNIHILNHPLALADVWCFAWSEWRGFIEF